jgi:transaldolase
MELSLDSVDFEEIEQAFELGFLTGLTTTPTFMHQHGITDIDGAIVKLSKMVPELQVEALGNTHDEIVAEAERLLTLPLQLEPVFKVPISQEGVRACNTLAKRGHRVNVHLIYTLNQAYMAMAACLVCSRTGTCGATCRSKVPTSLPRRSVISVWRKCAAYGSWCVVMRVRCLRTT